MISLNLPMMQVRYTNGRQLCYKENICCFVQDISNLAEKLPRMPEGCEVVLIRREGIDMSTRVDFTVRRDVARRALTQINYSADYFGGIDVSIIGDFSQLPPVKDRSLYAPAEESDTLLGQLSREGFTLRLCRQFTQSLRLRVIHRQQGDEPEQVAFRLLLQHASNQGLTMDDWRLLLTRYQHDLPSEEEARFADVPCLFPTPSRAVVLASNIAQLLALNRPCAKLLALNVGGAAAKKATADDTGGLGSEVLLCRGAKVMITRNIWQTNGTRVCSYLICSNVMTTLCLGLVHGAIRFVEDIVWAEGANRDDLCIAVLVSLKTYTGPTLWRTAPRPNFPDGVPIVPIKPLRKTSFELNGKHYSRTQLPLRLAWAICIHKSQGLALKTGAQIVLGSAKDFCVGLSFVALSRVTRLSDIMLVEKVDYTRVKSLGGTALQERLADFDRRYPA